MRTKDRVFTRYGGLPQSSVVAAAVGEPDIAVAIDCRAEG